MRKSVLAFLSFIGVIVLVFVGIAMLSRPPVSKLKAVVGTAELSGVDLTKKTAQISGWVHFGRQLVETGSIEKAKQTPVKAEEYGTFYMRVAVPDNQIYILGFNSLEFATRVYINGRLVDEIGKVSKVPEDFTPKRRYVHYPVNADNGEVEILLQYANFYTGYGISPEPPDLNIGLSNQMFALQAHQNLKRFSIFTLYVAAFLMYFGIFLFNTSRKENLFFSLACLVLAVREGFVGEQFISMLIPGITWPAIFVLQFIFIGLLVILSFSFIINMFPELVPKKGARVFYLMCFLFLVVATITKAYMQSIQTLMFLGIGVFIMVYILLRLFKNIRSFPPNRLISTAGIVILFLGLFNDMFHLFYVQVGPVGKGPLLQKVMIIFIMLQMIALFLQFMQAERELGVVRRSEAELASRNKMLQHINEERARFLSNVSHELKTPLTVVSNYAQLTQLHEQQAADSDEYIINKMMLVSSEASRMALMVEELIDIARIEEGRINWNFEYVDVRDLINNAIQRYYPVINKNRNNLVLDIQQDIPAVWADAQRIGQVVVNLITNAIKHTSRGTIRVAARYTGGGYVVISVEDTGAGMSKEQMEHLFERYYTSNGSGGTISGTGLGLVISREIVRAHNGFIAVDSALGEGTTVRVELPLEEQGGD